MCVLSSDSATTPSLIKIGYFLLRPTSRASAVAQSAFATAAIHSRRLCALALSSAVASLDHNDLMTLTRTRVPSLLTAIESDRRTNARI